MRTLILSIAFLAMAGCAATGPAFEPKRSSADATTGTVYVYRPSSFANMAGYPFVYLNGKKLGKLMDGGYTTFEVEPGPVNVEVKGEFLAWGLPDQSLTIRVERGKSYYARLSSQVDGFIHETYVGKSLYFGLVEEQVGASEIQSTRLSTP